MTTYTGSIHWLETGTRFWTRKRTVAALCLLLGLFTLRVGAQFLQLIADYSWLPAFEAWQSGLLPYPILLVCQLTIIGLAASIITNLLRSNYAATPLRGTCLCLFGRFYLYAMLIRLVAGLTVIPDHQWFASTLPTIFHIVLASFVLLLGKHERSIAINDDTPIYWNLIQLMGLAWYPAVVAGALLLHILMVSVGINLLVATYLPIILAAISIGLLEAYFPYRASWRADRKEILQDSIFMLFVQGLLPLGLGFLVTVTIMQSAGFHQNGFIPWPHHWPIAGQTILMLLVVDLARYWLHRAFHAFKPLWRIHAVHHSPKRLYWLNVARFHPLEKAIQFMFDAVPFILLGVDSTVISLYFVFYACNGFFQHSNVQVSLGWLNYIVSGPELHRWHHSVKKGESDRNFGNNLIVWDLMFGTRYLPGEASVGPVGLINRSYPGSFWAQLRTPFIHGIDAHTLPLLTMREIAVNLLLLIHLNAVHIMKGLGYLRAVRRPRAEQLRVLRRIVRNNASTAFGSEHNFTDIGSYDEFAARVPIQGWDKLAGYSPSDKKNGNGLTAEDPCFYQVTSGTTGPAKRLPLTRRGMKADRYLQGLNVRSYRTERADAFTGKIFAVVGPAVEGNTGSGIPYGSASGVMYQNMAATVRSKYVLPYSVFQIKNYTTRNFMTALMALSEPRVTIAVTANPSTLVQIRDLINEHFDTLVMALHTGTVDRTGLTPVQHADIEAKLANCYARAHELKTKMDKTGSLEYADIWPDLKLVNTWTGGSCGIALSSLLPGLPLDAEIRDLGYLASEVRATISLSRIAGVPTLRDTFFEFVERECWEKGEKRTLLLHELEVDTQYYVLITTANGLYRYFMNDIVEVSGRCANTATLRFLQKGRGVTNITGEKLYECQTLEAIRRLEKKQGIAVGFHQWIADEAESVYRVYLEVKGRSNLCPGGISKSLDYDLKGLNIEYDAKRKSGRLSAPVVKLLKDGTSGKFRSHHIEQGQREAQFKVMTLIYQRDSTFPLETMIRQGAT